MRLSSRNFDSNSPCRPVLQSQSAICQFPNHRMGTVSHPVQRPSRETGSAQLHVAFEKVDLQHRTAQEIQTEQTIDRRCRRECMTQHGEVGSYVSEGLELRYRNDGGELDTARRSNPHALSCPTRTATGGFEKIGAQNTGVAPVSSASRARTTPVGPRIRAATIIRPSCGSKLKRVTGSPRSLRECRP